MKKLFFCFATVFSILLTSCGCDIILKPAADGAEFTILLSFEKAFTDTFSALFPPDNENQLLFDEAQIKQTLETTGFEKVSVKNTSQNSLHISGKINKNGENPAVGSGIVEFADSGNIRLSFSAETLQKLYELLPFELKSYIDMLMAPSFTGEEISDEEYLDLVGTVYGEKVADELKDASVRFTVYTADGKTRFSRLSAIKLLNSIGTVKI